MYLLPRLVVAWMDVFTIHYSATLVCDNALVGFYKLCRIDRIKWTIVSVETRRSVAVLHYSLAWLLRLRRIDQRD